MLSLKPLLPAKRQRCSTNQTVLYACCSLNVDSNILKYFFSRAAGCAQTGLTAVTKRRDKDKVNNLFMNKVFTSVGLIMSTKYTYSRITGTLNLGGTAGRGYASCPIHTAPPILLREAPVTEASTLFS